MVVQQPRYLQWHTNYVSNLQNGNTIRCFQKGGVLSERFNRRSVVSPGVKPLDQCYEIFINQTSPLNIFKNVQFQISPFPSRHLHWNLESEFALSKEIMLTAEYLPGRLNVKADWAFRSFQDSSEWLL